MDLLGFFTLIGRLVTLLTIVLKVLQTIDSFRDQFQHRSP